MSFDSHHQPWRVLLQPLPRRRHRRRPRRPPRRWDEHEAAHKDTARSRLRGLAKAFFAARADATEAGRTHRRRRLPGPEPRLSSRPSASPSSARCSSCVTPPTTSSTVPVAATVETGSGLLARGARRRPGRRRRRPLRRRASDDGLDARPRSLEPAHRRSATRPSSTDAADVVGELFATDDPPRWVRRASPGRVVLLAERAKWAEGRFLAVDLDAALERNDTARPASSRPSPPCSPPTRSSPTTASRSSTSCRAIASQKHAVGVSQGAARRHPPQHRDPRQRGHRPAPRQDRRAAPTPLRRRRGRPEASPPSACATCTGCWCCSTPSPAPSSASLPVDDDVYLAGYSLDRLRELTLVDLDTTTPATAPTSTSRSACCSSWSTTATTPSTPSRRCASTRPARRRRASYEDYLQFPGLDAQLFDTGVDPAARRRHAPQRGPPAGAHAADAQPRGQDARTTAAGSSPTPSSASTSSARCTRA